MLKAGGTAIYKFKECVILVLSFCKSIIAIIRHNKMTLSNVLIRRARHRIYTFFLFYWEKMVY